VRPLVLTKWYEVLFCIVRSTVGGRYSIYILITLDVMPEIIMAYQSHVLDFGKFV